MSKYYPVRKPLFIADAFAELSVGLRQNANRDFYNFQDQHALDDFSPLGLAKNSVLTSCCDKEWFEVIAKQKNGLIVATRNESITYALAQDKHDVLLVCQDLSSLDLLINKRSDIRHYFSFIDFAKGKVFHVVSTLDMKKFQFVFSNHSAEEKTRISRKCGTHERNFEAMLDSEKRLVGSSVLNKLIL